MALIRGGVLLSFTAGKECGQRKLQRHHGDGAVDAGRDQTQPFQRHVSHVRKLKVSHTLTVFSVCHLGLRAIKKKKNKKTNTENKHKPSLG